MRRQTTLAIALTGALIAIPVFALAQSWTPAPANPPGSNTSAPINVGGIDQTKDGGLTVGNNAVTPNTGALNALLGIVTNGLVNSGGSYFVGKVGVGVLIPNDLIETNGAIRADRAATPSQYLQIDGGNAGSGYVRAVSNSNNRKSLSIFTSSSPVGSDAGVNNIYFGSGNLGSESTYMTILGGNSANPGNIGIGTTSPAKKFSVSGLVYSNSGFQFPDGTVQTTAAGGSGSSQWTTSGSSIYYNGGNTGIGTTSPATTLSVNGKIYSGTGGFQFPDGTVQTTAATPGSASSPWVTSGNNIFYPLGNVGVGTTNPGGTMTSNPTPVLDVNAGGGGIVNAAQYCITGHCLSSWPLYGFGGMYDSAFKGTDDSRVHENPITTLIDCPSGYTDSLIASFDDNGGYWHNIHICWLTSPIYDYNAGIYSWGNTTPSALCSAWSTTPAISSTCASDADLGKYQTTDGINANLVTSIPYFMGCGTGPGGTAPYGTGYVYLVCQKHIP